MKYCKYCNTTKDISNFTKNKVSADGYDYMCKDCKRIKKEKFYHSKRGVVVTLFDSQKLSSKHRKHPLPEYSLDELYNWCINQPIFHKLFNEWVESNYLKYTKPSIDRLDDYKPYTFDNIQIVSFFENEQKSHDDLKQGKNTSGEQCVPVNQYDLQNNYIATYYSINEASRQHNIPHQNIHKVCSGKRKHAGKYIWKFA